MNPHVWLFLDRAREDLLAAADALGTPRPWRAASDAYYAMFHAAQALLLTLGLRFSSHGGTHAAFGLHFAKTGRLDPKLHRYPIDAFEARLTADYDITVHLPLENVHTMVARAKEFVAAAEAYLETVARPDEPGTP